MYGSRHGPRAAWGHFDILVFLHHNRTEGFSSLASAHAADFGELELVQWLKYFYPRQFDSAAVRLHARSRAWPERIMQALWVERRAAQRFSPFRSHNFLCVF